MRRAGFVEAVGVALLCAVAAGAGYHLGQLVLSPYEASRAVILSVGFVYACYLLLRSSRRDGRVLAFTAWALASGVTAVVDPPVLFYLLTQLLMFWLIRVMCHHRRVLHGVLDGGIGLLSLGAALWALAGSGSVALACWSLLLCQALFTLLQDADVARDVPAGELGERFDRARRGAEMALRRVSTH